MMGMPGKMPVDFMSRSWEREISFSRETVNTETRTVDVAFSSETPYERYFGIEILSHESGAVDLSRLQSGRANVLINHARDDWVGVIEAARIDSDRIGRAKMRFGNSTRAEQVFADVKDGILGSVSVGYRIEEAKLTRMGKDGASDEYTVTRWTPYEISLVTIPADETVGVGRNHEVASPQSAITAATKELHMSEISAAAGGNAESEVINDGTQAERLRMKAIHALARQHKIDDKARDEWVDKGATVDQVSQKILDILAERTRTNPQTDAKLDLSTKDLQRYSLRNAILACADKSWKNAGLELECSRAVAEKFNRIPSDGSFFIPFDVQTHARGLSQRDLTAASAAGGGYLVSTNNMSFIELLRNRSVAFRMGATRLSGLQGNVTIPKLTAAATGYWLASESTGITESAQTFGQLALSPKTVGAYTEISRQLLLQSSPDAEGIVTSDLSAVCALAVDSGVLNGAGSGGEPAGIITTSGIGAVTGTSLAYAGILEFQTDVAAANVMPARGGYVTTPAVAALLMARQRFSSTDTPLWAGNIWDGQVSGFPAMSSNQMPSAKMLFGDWSSVVVAEWGVLEIAVNPAANFPAGIIGVRAMYSVDVGIRYAAAFSLASTIT